MGPRCVLAAACTVLGGMAALATWQPPETAAPAKTRVADNTETSGLKFVTPATQDTIDRGLEYLASRQNPDGSFGTSIFRNNPGIVGLCGLAFLSAGNTPTEGKYAPNVAAALDFLLAATAPNGYINGNDNSTHGPMYGHGFATLFLAEVYGMSPREELRPKLSAAVQLIINTQNKDGGWRYYPEPTEADISVTVCQIMALRAARNSGIYVPKDTVDACIKYVNDCQNQDGGFKYQSNRGSPSVFPRSAAGVVALHSSGVYEGRTLERGLQFLELYLPDGDVHRHEIHFFYGHYYAVQAMWQAGGERWNRWYPAIRDELIRRQLPDGSWIDSYSNEYGTAMACIILQVPNSYLPIFQR